MKIFLLAPALVAAPFLAPSPQLPVRVTSFGVDTPQENRLGNGGFETWPHGTDAAGIIGPGLWLAMGTTAGFYTQSAIHFVRAPENPACASGAPWCVEARANAPGNFISQSLEDYSGLADKWITFSVDLRTPFSVANPSIVIDDGITSDATTQLVGVGGGGSPRFTRLTVKHLVSKCATKLEFRIYPDQTVQINDAMAVVGDPNDAVFVPRANPEPGLMELPLGSIVDWYRFDANMPVPEGFAICNGAAIADTQSPFVGRATPNLADKFVRGVTTLAQIGSSGGADSHTSSHSHSGTTNTPNNGLWNYGPQNLPPFGPHHDHRHTFNTNTVTQTVPTVPSYVGLLKIMRVK